MTHFLLFLASCGGVARENGTYFVNPNHPETTDGTGNDHFLNLFILL